jgi:hypothetical protein
MANNDERSASSHPTGNRFSASLDDDERANVNQSPNHAEGTPIIGYLAARSSSNRSLILL